MATYPTAQQASAVYTLTSPTGDTAVFNDPLDASYAGALVGEDAVSGLDSPEVRNAVYDMVEADGAILGPQYHGMRPITLQPEIVADSVSERNEIESRLRRAINGCMRADGVLSWTPDGSVEQYVRVRKYQRFQIKGGYKKAALVSLVAGYPYIHSTALHTSSVDHATDMSVDNQGEEFGPAELIRVTGPGTGPRVRRTHSSVVYDLDFPTLTLAAGTYIDIDPWNKTITHSSGSNMYSYLDYAASTWWTLGPGINTCRVDWDSGATTASDLRIDWRDSWL